jgi:aarF domain-containing kinase
MIVVFTVVNEYILYLFYNSKMSFGGLAGLRLSSRTIRRAINRCPAGLGLQHRAVSTITTNARPIRLARVTSCHASSSTFHPTIGLRRAFHPSPASFARARRLPLTKNQRRIRRLRNLLVLLTFLSVLYYTYSPFRHTIIASVRCARLMKAVALDVLDYKRTFSKEEAMGALATLNDEQREIRSQARRDCHTRSAQRMLEALKKNSGIYVKLGQHVAAVQLLPKEWTGTMAPLQDQCFPSDVNDVDDMLLEDMAMDINQLFRDFNPNPIGVASLAQVHRAFDRRTNRPVAVKIQHPDLQEFARVDMLTVNFAISAVKYFFPDFEFSWLGEEMNEMLPLEMDFRHEAYNAQKTKEEFAHLEGKTSLYVPEVLWADRRCMVMEYIEGARVDDLVYLKDNGIDRNQVSQELSRIFSQMVYLNG